MLTGESLLARAHWLKAKVTEALGSKQAKAGKPGQHRRTIPVLPPRGESQDRLRLEHAQWPKFRQCKLRIQAFFAENAKNNKLDIADASCVGTTCLAAPCPRVRNLQGGATPLGLEQLNNWLAQMSAK